MGRKSLIACMAVPLVVIAVLVFNTLTFVSSAPGMGPGVLVDVDPQARHRLARAVTFKTVSSDRDAIRRAAQFKLFHQFLLRSFPLVHRSLKLELVNEFTLVYHWQGSNQEQKPVLLLSHQDVVPAASEAENGWRYAPFGGEVADGYIWGRGTWDDKSTLMAILEAVERLLGEGKKPTRTLVLAFGHDEEVGGYEGAAAAADRLERAGLDFEFVLDEGATITKGILPGMGSPVALIGIAEKGFLTLSLTASGAGGHSSMPPRITAAGRVSRAVHRLQSNPLPAELSEPVRAMFRVIGPEQPIARRIVLSNLWLFEPLLLKGMASNPKTDAFIRTTTAPTMLRAGVKENVLPQSASATVNFRIAPGQTREQLIEQVKAIVDDELLVIEALGASSNPSKVSRVDSLAFAQVRQAIRQVMPEVVVSPSLLFGATDARHYAALSEQIFRFTPITTKAEDLERVHGVNERISVRDYENMIRFYYQLISNSSL